MVTTDQPTEAGKIRHPSTLARSLPRHCREVEEARPPVGHLGAVRRRPLQPAGAGTYLDRSHTVCAYSTDCATERYGAAGLACRSGIAHGRKELDEKASAVTGCGAGCHGHGGEPGCRHHLWRTGRG